MDYKSSLQQPIPPYHSKTPPSQSFSNSSSQFLAKLKHFLAIHTHSIPEAIRYVSGGFGFAIYTTHNSKEIDQLFDQTFNMSLDQFFREAKRFGFSIKTKSTAKGSAVLLLSKEKLFDQKELNANLDFQPISRDEVKQEQEDQFPREEELQALAKKKEEASKVNVVKPNIILNKVMSEGNSGLPDWRRNDDASIQIKLEEQGEITHFFSSVKKEGKGPASQQGQAQGSALVDRSLNQKQNYQRCAKIIDTTIIEFLEAHRNNKLPLKKEQLMNNITEIYDILSNSIENIAGVVQLFGGREGNSKKEEISQGSLPEGFKSITQN